MSTTQTTLIDARDEAEQHRDQDTDDNLSGLLERDEQVDDLTDNQVIDTFVRGQMAHLALDAAGPGFMHSTQYQEAVEYLENGTLYVAAATMLGSDHGATEAMVASRDETIENALTLRERWYPDAEVDDMREHIKNALRGTGMDRIEIFRERVKHHANQNALTFQE